MTEPMIPKMLEAYRNKTTKSQAKRLTFLGVDGFDVYNPTAPFNYNGKNIICARVEKRDSEVSQAVFFEEIEEDVYRVMEGMKRYPLQDPCIAKVRGKYVLGGTEVFPHPANPEWVSWHTAFYYGDTLENLERLTEGPLGMKDIRLVELLDKRIGIFTRPQGEKGGRGKIGFTVIDDFNSITPTIMEEAPLLNMFAEEEWGGVNEAVLLPDGKIGVLGHIACFEPENVRHYYPMAFVFSPEDMSFTPPVILAERRDLLAGDSKRPDLEDVLFPGGLHLKGEQAILYVGVSDCEVQYLTIQNPFYRVYNREC